MVCFNFGQNGDLDALRKHAIENKISLDEMKEIAAGKTKMVGDRDGFVCNAHGCKVVFSIEEHPSGWMRHVSISSSAVLMQYPTHEQAQTITRELGYDNEPMQCAIWLENTSMPGVMAVNLLEPYNE